MDAKKFLEKWSNVASGYRICRFIVFVLTIFLTFLLLLYTKNVEREKIILLPPQVYHKVFIGTDSASTEYIKEMADYVIYLGTNYTPETVNSRLHEFLTYVEPSSYLKVKEQTKKISSDVKFYGKTQAFYPKKFTIDPKSSTVDVTGRLVKSYMGKTVYDKTVTFVLKYVIRNGEFLVASLYPKKENQEGKVRGMSDETEGA